MDTNKLNKLREIKYHIERCCGSCKNADIAPGSEWGTCKAHTYVHQKHTGEPRQLSINRMGCCMYHLWNGTMEYLEGFAEFIR